MSNHRKHQLYWLQCLTNLHAGTGDTNYGIIDKTVQRSVPQEIPVVHASGLKGAFRELFTHEINASTTATDYIFGAGSKSQEQAGNTNTVQSFQPGMYHFHEAHLLTLPVRCSALPFFSATSPALLKGFLQEAKLFLTEEGYSTLASLEKLSQLPVKDGQPLIFDYEKQFKKTVYLEDQTAENGMEKIDKTTFAAIAKLLGGENIALFSHEDFKTICKNLPVIARNNLENGISKNLWYEEIVPRFSRFYFFVSQPANATHDFYQHLYNENNGLVQVGGNATIGYGLCRVEKV